MATLWRPLNYFSNVEMVNILDLDGLHQSNRMIAKWIDVDKTIGVKMARAR